MWELLTNQGSLSTIGTVGSSSWSGSGSWSFVDLAPDTDGFLFDYIVTVIPGVGIPLIFDREIVDPKRELTTDDGTTRHTVSQGRYFWTFFGVRIKEVDERNDLIGPSNRGMPATVVVSLPQDQIVLTGTADFLTGVSSGAITVVPEPSTWLMFATGLLGLLGYGWRRGKRGV